MKCSTSIGIISDADEIYKVEDGEKFYSGTFTAEGVSVPCVVSEYLLVGLVGKAVQIEQYIRSETREDNKLFTFLQIVNIKEAEDGAAECNFVEVGGVVSQVKTMKVQNSSGTQVLPFIIKYRSHDRNYNVAHVVAKGANARKLNKLKKGDILEVKGTLKTEHGALEVLVTDIDVYEQRP